MVNLLTTQIALQSGRATTVPIFFCPNVLKKAAGEDQIEKSMHAIIGDLSANRVFPLHPQMREFPRWR
jgi:hypothetical protein